jgi:hypothetical protein
VLYWHGKNEEPRAAGYIAFCKVGGRASFQKHFGLRNECTLLLRMGSSFFYYQNLEEQK